MLIEGRRWRVHLAAARVGVVVEADRGTGESGRPEGRVVDLEQQALGEGLLPGVHVIDGADLARGDAGGREDGEPVLGRLVGEVGLQGRDQRLAVGDSQRVGGKPRVARIQPECRAQVSP